MINDSPLLYTRHDGQNNNGIAVVGSLHIDLNNIYVSSMKSKHGKNRFPSFKLKKVSEIFGFAQCSMLMDTQFISQQSYLIFYIIL